MKICAKNDCQNIAIHRGKYCNNHRTNKKKIIIDDESKEEFKQVFEPIYNTQKNLDINYDIERMLKEEQEDEYSKAMNMDIQRMILQNEEKHIKDTIELSKKMFIEEKKSKIKGEPEESKENYIFQFKLPNNSRIKRIFHNNSTMLDIRNFLDVYFYENQIKIENYDLITFPKKIFNKDENNKLSEYNFEKNILFYIHDLDS